MFRRNLLSILLFIASCQIIAQPCNVPPFPGEACQDSPLFCKEDLEGSCYTTAGYGLSMEPSFCVDIDYTGDQWFKFIAGDTMTRFVIDAVNAQIFTTSSSVLQVGIRDENCNTIPFNSSCSGISLVSNLINITKNLIPGDIYYLFVCERDNNTVEYEIIEAIGVASDVTGNISSIEGNAEVCIGSIETYSVDITTNALSYNWTITPPEAGTFIGYRYGNEVNIKWNTDSPVSLLAAPIGCGAEPSTLMNVNPYNLTPEFDYSEITRVNCLGDTAWYEVGESLNGISYVWDIPGIATLIDSTENAIQIAWNTIGTGEVCVFLVDSDCDIFDNCFDILVAPPLPEILNVPICEGTCFNFNDTSFCEAGVYQLPTDIFTNCDSVISFSVEILEDTYSQQIEYLCSGECTTIGGIEFCDVIETTLTIPNSVGCDSIIDIAILEVPFSLCSANTACSCINCPLSTIDYDIVGAEVEIQDPLNSELGSNPLTKVCFSISHTWVGDLSISLISPSGLSYLIMADEDNEFFGCISNDGDNVEICILPGTDNPITNNEPYECQNLPCQLGDCCLIGDFTMPCGGVSSVSPTQMQSPNCDLNDFNIPGHPVNGTWTLAVADNCFQDEGIIHDFYLEFENNYSFCIDTIPCEADAGKFDTTEFFFCDGDTNFSLQPTFQNTPPDTMFFGYKYLLSIDDESFVILDSAHHSLNYGLTNFTIYGISYELMDENLLFSSTEVPIEIFEEQLSNPDVLLCADISNPVSVIISSAISNTFVNTEICQGDSYSIGSQVFTASGSYFGILESYLGCDSIILLDLEVFPADTSQVSTFVCPNECAEIAGQEFCEEGLYEITFNGTNGCDSILQLSIIWYETDTTFLDTLICANDCLDFGGQEFCEPDTYSVIFANSNNCDSVVILNLNWIEIEANISPPSNLDCGQNQQITLESTVNINAFPSSQILYNWEGPNILSGADTNAMLTDAPGNYCLTATHLYNGIACDTTVCVEVFANTDFPNTPFISGDTLGCVNAPFVFAAMPDGNPVPDNFSWTSSPNVIINVLNFNEVEVVFPETGIYEICVVAQNDCGQSAPNCLEIEIYLPTITLGAGGSICANSMDLIEVEGILTGISPWQIDWSLNGVVQPSFSISSDVFLWEFSALDAGFVEINAVTDAANCTNDLPNANTEIELFPVPTATISGGGELCEGSDETVDIEINLTGLPPFEVVYSFNNLLDTIAQIDSNNFILTIDETGIGTYIIEEIIDGNNCFNIGGNDSVTVELLDSIFIQNVIETCDNSTNETYILSFEIWGGDQSSVQVEPMSGTFSGSEPTIFTSEPINSGNGYEFLVSDGNACEVIPIQKGEFTCPCFTEVGDLENVPTQNCSGLVSANHLGNEFLDANDILVFGLSEEPFEIPIIWSETPEFLFDGDLMTYGTIYYLSAIAGNNAGNDLVDLSDPCAEISDPVEVIFSELSGTISGSGTICEGSGETVNLFIEIQGNPPFEVTYSVDGVLQETITIATTNPNILTVSEPGIYKIESISDASGCSALGNNECAEVLNAQPVQIQNVLIDENVSNTFYIVSFEIFGNPDLIEVTPNIGTLSGANPSLFVSFPIVCGEGFSFEVSDGAGCPPVVVEQAIHFCECDTEVGTMDEMLIEVEDGNTAFGIYLGGEVLDSNDVLSFGLFEQPFNFPFSLAIAPEITFDPITMDYGKTYYMAALAGNDNGGGFVDVSDPCLAISNFVEVIFYANATGVPPPNSFMGNTNIELLAFGNKFQKGELKKAKPNFKIFPNPTSNQLFIHSNNEEITEIELFDFNGKMVKQVVPKSANIEMNLEALPAGVYLIKIRMEKEIWTETILKM